MLTPEDHARGVIYPRVGDIRKISAHIAAAVMRMADYEGLSSEARPGRRRGTLTRIETSVLVRRFSAGFPLLTPSRLPLLLRLPSPVGEQKSSIKMNNMTDEELVLWVQKKMFKPDYGVPLSLIQQTR